MAAPRYHRFGPFVVIRPIGYGAMAEVHLARTEWPDTPLVAIKLLKPQLAEQEAYSKRFAHEAALAIRLEHPNVVAALGSGQVDGRPYLASQYIAGQDAAAIIRKLESGDGTLTVPVAVRLLRDLLEGLAYLHDARRPDGQPLSLVHQDIGPGNVLVGYDGRARIADFGIASSTLAEGRNLPGPKAPADRAPGQQAGQPNDVLALGVLMRRILEAPNPYAPVALPLWLTEILKRMTDPDPAQRRQAADLARTVELRARRTNALVGNVACARWMESTFPEARQSALDEQRRLLSVNPDQVATRADHTVTFIPSAIADGSGEA